MKAIRKAQVVVRQSLRQVEWVDGADLASLLHRLPMVLLSAIAITGVWLDTIFYRSLESTIWFCSAICLPCCIYISVRLWFGKPSRMGNMMHCIITALMVVSSFAIAHAYSEQSYRDATINRLLVAEGQPVIVRGKLSKTVSLRPNPLASGVRRESVSPWQSRLRLDLSKVRVRESFEPINGRIVVYVEGDLNQYVPGDELEVYGWLYPFEAPTNPGEPDLRDAFRIDGLHGRIDTKDAGAVRLIKQSDQFFGPLISRIAQRGREALLRTTDERTGPLAVALVIGQREFVDSRTRDTLLATGTAHLLSVSGMHLAIIVLVVTWLVSGLGLRPLNRFLVVVAISALYVAVTGGRPPVFRAAILISMLLFSSCLHRPSQPLNTLGFAALVLMLLNPMNVFSVGVHLSFLAVITLMLTGRDLVDLSVQTELQLQRDTNFDALVESASLPWVVQIRSFGRFVRQMAWLSLCVTAISLPLVWSQFHCVSMISVVTNVLVWIGLMFALPAGVLTVILDPISSSLAMIPGAICHYALAYMWMVIQWTESWPGGHAWLPSPPRLGVWMFYAVLAASMLWKSRTARWWRRGWIALWPVVMFFIATRVSPMPAQTLEATFIDVGHGTCVIIRDGDQRVWLYDCGRMGNDLGTSRYIDSALWHLGVTHLDAVFLSHADSDHYNALPALLERFSIDCIITPPGMLYTDESSIDSLRETVLSFGVPVKEISSSKDPNPFLRDWFSAVSLKVLHPPIEGVGGNDNANSLVLQLDHGGRSLILPGDLETPGTEMLTSEPRPIAGGVLMAPHHGSLSMNADTVLAWARPNETIVSGSKRAARVEVAEMLSVTGSQVTVTSKQGAVRVRIDGDGRIQVRTWSDSPW